MKGSKFSLTANDMMFLDVRALILLVGKKHEEVSLENETIEAFKFDQHANIEILVDRDDLSVEIKIWHNLETRVFWYLFELVTKENEYVFNIHNAETEYPDDQPTYEMLYDNIKGDTHLIQTCITIFELNADWDIDVDDWIIDMLAKVTWGSLPDDYFRIRNTHQMFL